MNAENCAWKPSHEVKISEGDLAYSIVQNAVHELWQVVNHLARIRPPRRERYSVTIFGSARLAPEDEIYAQVRDLASQLTEMGCDIITGGGPGLMQAANEGSVLADPEDSRKSIGIRVALGFEQETNPYVEQVYCHQTFFSRLQHFVLISDAFIVVPGGIGTTLEALMIWQLLQVRQLENTPLIFIGEMWSDFIRWAETHMLNQATPLANPADFSIPKCVHNYDEAIALIQIAHSQWQAHNPSHSTPL